MCVTLSPGSSSDPGTGLGECSSFNGVSDVGSSLKAVTVFKRLLPATDFSLWVSLPPLNSSGTLWVWEAVSQAFLS